jgi:Asp/Glu/hydantoin racemase
MASSKIDPGLASPDIPAKLNPPASPPWQSNITDIRRRHPKTPIVEPSSTLDSIVVDTGPPSSPSTRVKFAEPTPSIDRPNRPGQKITFAGYDSTNTRTQIHPNHRRPLSTPKTPRPFTQTVSTIAKARRARESPIFTLDPPAKRKRFESAKPTQRSKMRIHLTPGRQSRILVINPNTSTDMTDGLAKLIRAQGASERLDIDLYKALDGPASIDNEVQALESARLVIEDLVVSERLAKYDAFLVACYSVHPLVGFIQGELQKAGLQAHVTGIFEASMVTALSLLPPTSRSKRFGIVSTGKSWEKVLSEGVKNFLGTDLGKENPRFGGVATTGLNAGELHSMPEEKVKERMKDAVKLLCEKDDIEVVILGCAGMAGMDAVVHEALVEKYGEKGAKGVVILDGVKCGIGMLENLVKTVPLQREEEVDC